MLQIIVLYRYSFPIVQLIAQWEKLLKKVFNDTIKQM